MKKIKIFKLLLLLVTFSLSIYFSIKLIKFDILPNKYLKIIFLALLVVNILILLCLIAKKRFFKVMGTSSSVLTIAVLLFFTFHISNISNIFDKMFGNNKIEITNYSVVSLNNNNFGTIEELETKSVGYVASELEDDEYIEELKKTKNIKLKEYKDSYSLYSDLMDNKIDTIVLNEVYLDALKEENEEMDSKINVISNIEVKKEVKTEDIESDFIDDDIEDENVIETENKENNTEENNEIISEVNDISNEQEESVKIDIKPFSILISGSDSRSSNISNKIRSDVNLIVTVNPSNHKILLTSIPRDTYVQIHGTTGNKDKLTHVGGYGLYKTKATIQDLLHVKIDYSIKVGFSYTIKLINILGGVDVYSDKSFTTYNKDGGAQRVNIKKGMNHLNGAQALSYVRERYAYSDGDFHRIKNQQQVLEAMIKKLTNNKDLLLKYDEILNSLKSMYVTDIPSDLVKKLVKHQIDEFPNWKIESQSVKATGMTTTETYSLPGLEQYVAIPVQSSINSCSSKIKSTIRG